MSPPFWRGKTDSNHRICEGGSAHASGVTDPTAIVVAALTLIAVTLGAAYIPAARAACVSPINSLRADG
jgi:hypothetical protein